MHSQKSIGPKKANSIGTIGTVGQIFFERAQCACVFFFSTRPELALCFWASRNEYCILRLFIQNAQCSVTVLCFRSMRVPAQLNSTF